MDDRHVAIVNTVLLRVLIPAAFIVIGIHNFMCTSDKRHAQPHLNRELEMSSIDKCYFVSPMYPDTINSAGEHSMNIKKKSKYVGQIRMEFIHFDLAPPNSSTKICDADVLSVTGGEHDNMKICGPFDGQHVVYELDHLKDDITIRINLNEANYNRRWMIRIIQIESTQRMPTGCFQYFYEAEGTVQAIDFTKNGRELSARPNDRICIRHMRHKCSIEYEPCDWDSITYKVAMFSSIVFPGSPISKKVPFGPGGWEKNPKRLN